jgi:hypothetical protein
MSSELTTWCPAVDTSVSTNGTTVTISSNGTVYAYDTIMGTGRGFAPMYYGQISGSSFSVSASIKLSIQYKANCNVYAGFMLFTSNLVPLCEFGIGGNNLGSLDPIYVQTYCSFPTFISSDNISGVMTLQGGDTQVQFNDGTKTTQVRFTKPPMYMAMYLRGSGKNSATFSGISLSGIGPARLPSYIPFGLEIPGAYYYGGSVSNTSKITDVANGKVICISDSTASAFSFDTETNECRLIQDLEITNIKASKTATLYIQSVPVISEVFVATGFIPVNVNNLSIEAICIDNTNGFRDAVIITASNIFICSNFTFTPVRMNNTETAVLCINLPVNGSNIYIYSLNNYDYKRIGLVDNNFNKIGGTFINQHFRFDKTKSGTWYLANSNSYTNFSNIATYTDFYLNYGNGKFQFCDKNSKSGVSSIIGQSSCKLIATAPQGNDGTRFLCLNQTILILINGESSFWRNDNIKGSLFFNKDAYDITYVTGPNPPATPFVTTPPTCIGTTTSIHIKYGITYLNFVNNHTCIFNLNGTYTFRGGSYTYNNSSFNILNVPGVDCLAEIQLTGTKPTNVLNIYANESTELLSDDDYAEFPLFVKYQVPNDPATGLSYPPVIIEFIPVTVPNNYMILS